ncbi:hypothetical protein V1478_008838 [Vespula squamosa]|uniref:Uncharacterized protein n=1 Tax=Vespula squamosa TaxID=30214 RepID=A0ABD2AXC0_VESSQ
MTVNASPVFPDTFVGGFTQKKKARLLMGILKAYRKDQEIMEISCTTSSTEVEPALETAGERNKTLLYSVGISMGEEEVRRASVQGRWAGSSRGANEVIDEDIRQRSRTDRTSTLSGKPPCTRRDEKDEHVGRKG